MFEVNKLPLKNTGLFNKLVIDYLLQTKQTTPLYNQFPDLKGFQQFFKEENNFNKVNRTVLVNSLEAQANLVNNTTTESRANIQKLKNSDCYTITTGHQLCLFTGPVYFIYKIISTINLSEWLNKNFTDKKFVPVYWMASEDNDFEEVNHAHVFGKKITWNSQQTGAVGDFKTNEIELIIAELENILGNESNNNKEVLNLFREAYLNNSNLKNATRYLVNALFGKYGLVVVDGNQKELKSLFTDSFKKDIFENISYAKVNETKLYFEKNNYPVQVNPREVNCFYIDKGIRSRIEKNNENFTVVNTSLNFTKEELNTLIETETQKISPNVVLRPLYQQFILPNIAYVGGPGELTYWLQYKALFETFQITLPLLVPRKFIAIIEKGLQNKISKLSFSNENLFESEQNLIQSFLKNKGITIELKEEKTAIETIYNKLIEKAVEIDKSLEGAIKADNQKTLNSIAVIEQKLNKALKQKADNEINQIKTLKAKLFPEGIPQERFDNFTMYYSKWGKEFITALKEVTAMETLNNDYLILKEN